MSKKNEGDDAKDSRKGGGLIKKLILAILLIGAGGGGAFAMVAMGVVGSVAEEETGPERIRKGDEDPYAPAPEKDAVEVVHGEGGSEYRTAYFRFGEGFTTNLKSSDAMVQLSLAVSTTYDGRVLMWLEEHELALRSRVLVELAATPESDAHTLEGKKRLQERLTQAINEELAQIEGFGGVDNVHFQSYIVQ